MKDGMVIATLFGTNPFTKYHGNPVFSEAPRFSITFYDMPYIDNTRFTTGSRLAVILEKFISPADYAPFLEQITEPTLRQDYLDLSASKPRILRMAVLRLVLFPEGYLGLRDRPYLEEVIQQITKGPSTEKKKVSQ